MHTIYFCFDETVWTIPILTVPIANELVIAVAIWHIEINVNVHWSQPLVLVFFCSFAHVPSSMCQFFDCVQEICDFIPFWHRNVTFLHQKCCICGDAHGTVNCNSSNALNIVSHFVKDEKNFENDRSNFNVPFTHLYYYGFFPSALNEKKSTPIKKDFLQFNWIQWKNRKDWKIHEKNKSTLNGNNKLQRRIKATRFNFMFYHICVWLRVRSLARSFRHIKWL